MDPYEVKRRRLVAQLRAARDNPVGLGKATSNLFRERRRTRKATLDVRDFDQILAVDPQAGWLEAEGMTRYDAAVDAALAAGLMPAVVPELRSITLGGAAAGVAIESSSFRYGLMHETVLELDVLLADGRVVTCSADNEHSALFFGFPNSYGTLGYALRVRVKALPVKPFVHLRHRRFEDAGAFFDAVDAACSEDIDFLDGTVFSEDQLHLTTARFVAEAPYTSDYTFERMYFRSVAERTEDYLTSRDYIWRWDTDWFWCSKNVGAQHPLIRRLLGRSRLNSVTYTRIMRWNARWGLTGWLDRLRRRAMEGVIQDVDIPIRHAPEFLAFLFAEVGIRPIWICPIRAYNPQHRYPLYPLDPQVTYINFGFWDRVPVDPDAPKGHLNRRIEQKVAELGGIKSLYSSSYFSEPEFWSIYDGEVYAQLKEAYDPQRRLADLYRKCVLRE
jgi:FAD/FMN-containing dehydrogenase